MFLVKVQNLIRRDHSNARAHPYPHTPQPPSTHIYIHTRAGVRARASGAHEYTTHNVQAPLTD